MSNNYPPYPHYPPPGGAPPPKKSGPLVWILVGCAGLFFMAVVAVIATGVFVYHKAKQAGLDPELMEKNPALAAGKMAAKLIEANNPDVEVVSIDEDRGVIILKHKGTGETVTMNLSEVESGRVVFTSEGKEGEAAIETNPEGGSGAVEFRSKEGKMKFGSTTVNVPGWLPPYPGAAPVGTFSMEMEGEEAGGFHFTTGDSVEQVISFYEDGLKGAGFEVKAELLRENGRVSSGMASGEDTARKLNAVINAASTEDGTRVSVAFGARR